MTKADINEASIMMPKNSSSSLFLQRNLPNDDHNEANISRNHKVKQTQIKRKYVLHLQGRRNILVAS